MRELTLIGGVRDGEDAPLLVFAEEALRLGFGINVITSTEQAGSATADQRPLLKRLQELDIGNIQVLPNPVTKNDLEDLKASQSIGVSLNSHWIFRDEVIRYFDGNLINYHNTALPKERGAAAYSWRMMMGRRETGLTFHRVDTGVDTGGLIMQESVPLRVDASCVADDYKAIASAEGKLFKDILALIGNKTPWPHIEQDETISEYWPRLETCQNGFIDWSWTAEEIVQFIKAFDSPYPGASTFMNGVQVRLKRAEVAVEDGNFHPFQAGLIYRQINGKTFIATRRGGIFVRQLVSKNGDEISKKLLGYRLMTPSDILENARTYRPTFKKPDSSS